MRKLFLQNCFKLLIFIAFNFENPTKQTVNISQIIGGAVFRTYFWRHCGKNVLQFRNSRSKVHAVVLKWYYQTVCI